jgi:hypothetical protein
MEKMAARTLPGTHESNGKTGKTVTLYISQFGLSDYGETGSEGTAFFSDPSSPPRRRSLAVSERASAEILAPNDARGKKKAPGE